MRKIKILALCISAASAGLYMAPIHAQDQPVAEQKKWASSSIDEVVVTARQTAEDIQTVPLAIQAFSAEALENRGIQNMEDIANATPGLNYAGGSSSGYQSSATIRGLAQGFLQDRTQNVAIFFNGIYLQRQSMANVSQVDMESVQVLKGPQSSLYGRNAFSGLIAYTTKKPTEETTGYVSTTQGDNDRQDYQGRISGTLIEEKVLGSFTYGTTKYNGHTENKHPFAKVNPPGFSDGDSDGLLGGWDDRTYNLGLQFNINEALTLSGNYYNTNQRRETQPAYIVGGVREVGQFATTPYGDMNSNPVVVNTPLREFGVNPNAVAYGNTIWSGRLPTKLQPGKYIGYTIYDANNPNKSTWAYTTTDFGYGSESTPANRPTDPRIPGAVSDPRTVGVKAETEISDITLAWAINDDWTSKYTYGYVNHTGFTGGEAERDPLYGTYINDVGTGDPYPDGSPIIDPAIQTNAFSSRPIIDTAAASHEVRFEWAGNDVIDGSFGFYYSKVDDRAYDQTTYASICSNRYPNAGEPVDRDQPNQSAGCYQAVDNNTNLYDNTQPLNQAQHQFIYGLFRDYWNGSEANDTLYNDHIRSAFAATNIKIVEDVRLRLEGRFTEERRKIDRQSDAFGLKPGQIVYIDNGEALYENILIGSVEDQAGVTGYGYPSGGCAPGTTTTEYAALVVDHNPQQTIDDDLVLSNGKPTVKEVDCIPQYSSDTSQYFAPRIGLDWEYSADTFLYTYMAKGVKAGGFNNTSDASQQAYDEEQNWTYEVGSKNTFLDGALTLNVALYYVDWTNTQGSEAPKNADGGPNANAVVGNIAGITNFGQEINGSYNITDTVFIDFGGSWTDPKYKDGATFDAAQRYYFKDCDPSRPAGYYAGENYDTDGVMESGETCGDGDIGGYELARVSKQQYTWGVNYVGDLVDTGWLINARLGGNYQSEQWVDQLNEAYIPSRTLWDTSVKFSAPEHWELIFWGKNITNKEYVSGAFSLALFNKYIVAYGAGPSYGVTAKYNF